MDKPMFKPQAGVGKPAEAKPKPSTEVVPSEGFIFDPTISHAERVMKATQNVEPGPVKAWAYSSLKNFESCPHSIFLKSVKKCPQPGNKFSERGIRIHDLAEKYTKGEIEEMPDDLTKVAKKMDYLREEFEKGNVMCEDEWAYTQGWKPVGWRDQNAWLRMKLDAMVWEDKTSVHVIDHKTGKRFGNELKHGEQLQLYALATFLRFPEIEFARVSNWYIDGHEPLTRPYTRKQAMVFHQRWTERGISMTTAKHFPAKPNKHSCRFCPFKETGACEFAE